jgi:predicted dehydrogenase
MNRKLTVAIMGAGQMAGGYDSRRRDDDKGVYTHAGAYLRDGRFRLHTVCDPEPGQASSFGAEWGAVEWTSAPEDIFASFHDVVSVCTPDSTHFALISELIARQACRTVFAEKPLALTEREIESLIVAAREQEINIVVNFQRRFDPTHARVREIIRENSGAPLAVNGYYIKGLDHIGITMIDTLTYILGRPRRVFGYNRVWNPQAEDETYEFILYYDGFNATIKTVDSTDGAYHYHIFEIDLLLPTRRLILNDNSRTLETRVVGEYGYSGVTVLDDNDPGREETGYSRAMLGCVNYLYDITANGLPHKINTAEEYRRTKAVADAIRLSYEQGTPLEIIS